MDRAALGRLLAAVRQEYPGFLTLLVADEQGEIIATAAGEGAGSVGGNLAGVADRPYFRQAVATRQPYVSNVFLGRGLGHDLIVAISAPVVDPAGRVRLVVEGSLNLRKMTDAIGGTPATRDRDLVVTDSANQIVCSTGSLALPALTSFADHGLFFAAHSSAEPTFLHDQAYVGWRHPVRQLASHADVTNHHWSVYLQEPIWRSQRPVAAFDLTLLIVAALALAAALLMARGTTAVATRPLEGLVESARALAQVSPAAQPPDPLPAPTEILQLSRSVHTATLRLSENNAELEQTNRELRELARTLDQRVQERTAELEEARAMAESANRAKSEFLASMSHELRTPLSVILGNASLLGDGLLGQINLRQADSVKGIDESGQHLLSLINDILDLSKIEAGMLELDYADVDATEICEAALRMIAGEAAKKKLTVETDYMGVAEVSFVADARRTKQIVVNLLTNAVKFTPANGRISLRATADLTRGAIDFSVADNGIGIALDRQRKLFRPFVQIDSRLAREYAGTGLGLALVKQLTDLHGGSVSLVSAPEQGSTFTVSLPLRRDTGSRIPFPLRTEAAGIGRINGSPLILAAEDHETNIAVLRAYFTAQSCRVVFARDGLEAIERALANPPDIILMDVQMPRLDGLQAIKRLREDERTAKVPIVCLTALGMVDDRERCLQAGADYYICKPINFPELTQTINQLLASRKGQPA
jgi:signal transduction histidine kinase/CheY-like chemotaxis protein